MKKSRFTKHQIVGILNQAEAGVAVTDLCREHGISKSSHILRMIDFFPIANKRSLALALWQAFSAILGLA